MIKKKVFKKRLRGLIKGWIWKKKERERERDCISRRVKDVCVVVIYVKSEGGGSFFTF